MNINLEATEAHAIQAYSDSQIQINAITYERSLIVSKEEIIPNLQVTHIRDIDEHEVQQLLKIKPEVIIIGHKNTGEFINPRLVHQLGSLGIGVECMNLGAACRTYNVLLSEERAVTALFIL
ncbi:MAG: hypothetical protein BGO90_05185 [Legionella sp. 40-6]|nr:hypothetical protein [Legionella sp.]OJX91867.1 MAG: hypothetical protein BGO90_05185 [Legionella sp. 40-6]